MILTPHMAAGVAIAILAPHPAIGLPLAFLSHYVLDALPHAEYNTDKIKQVLRGNLRGGIAPLWRLFLDGAGGFTALVAAAILFNHASLLAAGGAIAGILPDGLTVLLWMLPRNKILARHFNFHSRVHFPKDKRSSQFLRIGLQIGILIFTALVLVLT